MKQKKRLAVNLALMSMSIIFTIAVIEGILRIFHRYETFNAATELPWMRNNEQDLSQFFTVDADIGFHPILGKGFYSPYGTLPNDYPLEKRPNVTRLLFIGDSVTLRGKIIHEIKERYDDIAFEYWNAGVESFNTAQEVKFYLRYNSAIQPDHVILTFHLNDFEATPVAFFNEKKQLVVYIPHAPLKPINRWLFEKSCLYRWLVGITLKPEQGKQAVKEEIQTHLRILRDTLAERHIKLTIFVFPLLKSSQEWSQEEQKNRDSIIDMLQHLHIRYFDFFDVCQAAIRNGIQVQETPGDSWHPSAEAAQLFAQHIYEHGWLSE